MKAENLLTDEEEQIVFASISQITGLSDQLLADFELALSDWNSRTSTIGDLFQKYANFFKMYIPFSNNFSHGLQILQTKDLKEIMKQAQSRGVQALEALRILPIQRIPRYCLLLDDLIKNTNPGHPDYDFLRKALDDMKTVANHINERMKMNEREAKVLEIQSSLWTATGIVPELVRPGRIFVKEGSVSKVRQNGKLKRNYHLFCFNDIVVYATSNRFFKNRFHFHKAIEFFGAFVADVEARQLGALLNYGECAFKVTGSNGYRIFVVPSDSERRDWISAINDLANQNSERRKSWGRARGQLINDDDDDDDLDD